MICKVLPTTSKANLEISFKRGKFTICPFRARKWPFQAPKPLRFKEKMANFEAKNTIKQGKMANFEATNTIKQGKKRQKDKWYPFHACTVLREGGGAAAHRSNVSCRWQPSISRDSQGFQPPDHPDQCVATSLEHSSPVSMIVARATEDWQALSVEQHDKGWCVCVCVSVVLDSACQRSIASRAWLNSMHSLIVTQEPEWEQFKFGIGTRKMFALLASASFFCERVSERKRHINFIHINFLCRPSSPGLSLGQTGFVPGTNPVKSGFHCVE